MPAYVRAHIQGLCKWKKYRNTEKSDEVWIWVENISNEFSVVLCAFKYTKYE